MIYFTLPGLGGSDEQHWQSRFEKVLPNCCRIEQKNWDKPDCTEWVSTVKSVLDNYNLSEVVLICHSLGCITLAHLVAKYQIQIKAALLVAPPDIDNVPDEFELSSFKPLPKKTLPFPTVLVASENDPWSTLEKSKQLAEIWGSEFVSIGKSGHINTQSGLGNWEYGQDLLKELIKNA